VTATATPATTDPITRDDLEAKFRELNGEVAQIEERNKNTALIVGVAVGVAVVVGAYLLGRRRGKKSRPIVEIRRV
jgi:hypothetical protein